MSHVVVGLDLSLTGTGMARLGPYEEDQVTTLSSKGKTADSLATRRARLARIADLISDHIGSGPTYAVAIETPAHNQTSGHHHDRSGLWWMVMDRLLNPDDRSRLEPPLVYEVATTQVKKYATGKGNASKMEVMAAAIKRYPQFDIANDNEADAVILAAFLARALGEPIEESLPQANLAALDKFSVSD